MKKILLGLFLSLALFTSTGCQKTPYTNRNQLVLISPHEEIKMGEQASREILKKEKISKDIEKTKMVERVGKRIAKVAKFSNFNWEFHLIDKDVLNAFCLPGGKVFVYTGIFKTAKNEDQLATVMAHEIAHALAHHGAERMSMGQIAGIAQLAIGEVTGLRGNQLFNVAYGLGTQIGVMLPYSRSFENEADEIGIYLMNEAGYDVKEALKFWENMKSLKKSGEPLEFLSTHPTDNHRIENIKRIIASMQKRGQV
jgi:predicted Zn-dependent protease